MKTAVAKHVPQHWTEILQWVSAGEEVQLMEQDKVVARIVPPVTLQGPDFLARAKAVWGNAPGGKMLSDLVSESRGGGS